MYRAKTITDQSRAELQEQSLSIYYITGNDYHWRLICQTLVNDAIKPLCEMLPKDYSYSQGRKYFLTFCDCEAKSSLIDSEDFEDYQDYGSPLDTGDNAQGNSVASEWSTLGPRFR